MKVRPIFAAGVLGGLTGCVTGELTSISAYREPDPGHVAELRRGESELGECLELLGAPLFVSEEGDGAVLAWGWFEGSSWGVGVRVPLSSDFSASFKYSDIDSALEGVVLFFDADWRLIDHRSGYLRDILKRRRRPQNVD